MDIAVVADDFTGANANGALLTAKGFSSATCLSLESWKPEQFSGYTAVCLNVESRLLARQEAWNAVHTAVSCFMQERPGLIAKRVDSTLRGNVGVEIEAALQAMDAASAPGQALAVVVPSYPSSGRICVGGYLIVHGIPLERSPIAADSATPIHHTSVHKIIAEQSSIQSGFVPLEKVLAGADAVRDAVGQLKDQGCRVVICDAVADEDIAVVARALATVPYPLLAVDPGPFTAELAALRVQAPRVEFEDRVLLCIGSTSELTRTQIEALRLAHAAHICKVSVRDVLQGGSCRDAEERRLFAELSQMPSDATVLGVCTATGPEDVFPLEDLARELNLSPSDISVRINEFLAGVTLRMLGDPELRIGGLYTSGGEVTVANIRALDASGFTVRDQVLPLAVYGHIIGGRHPDLPMITKGGFVGDQNTLVECVEYLFTKISTKTRKG